MTAPEPTAIQDILAERGSRYGSFDKHADITQRIKAEMRDAPNWEYLTNSMRESLEMVAHKIGRILNGDPTYADSWVDIVGYTQLVVNELVAYHNELALAADPSNSPNAPLPTSLCKSCVKQRDCDLHIKSVQLVTNCADWVARPDVSLD